MTRRARQRRRRRQQRRRQQRRRHRRHGHTSHGNLSLDSLDLSDMFEGSCDHNRNRRALFIGGSTCIAVGVVCIISPDHSGLLSLIAVVCLFFGVFMLGCLLAVCYVSKKEEEHNQTGPTDVIVHPTVSNHLQQPLVTTQSGRVSPAPYGYPAGHSPQMMQYIPSASRESSGYIPTISGQVSYHALASSARSSRNPSPVSMRHSPLPPSNRSTPVSGRHSPFLTPNRGYSPVPPTRTTSLSTNRSRTPVADDPPPYPSVMSGQPWEKPPSYQEAASCLVPRVEVTEAFSPSAPDISNSSVQDHPLSVASGRSSVVSDPSDPGD